MCTINVGLNRSKQKLQTHCQRIGHLKMLKVPQETALVLTPSSGNIPIPLWFIFGLDEEHMDTRAHIALLAPPPPSPAPRGLYPIFPQWVGKVWEIGRTEAWGGDGSPTPPTIVDQP